MHNTPIRHLLSPFHHFVYNLNEIKYNSESNREPLTECSN